MTATAPEPKAKIPRRCRLVHEARRAFIPTDGAKHRLSKVWTRASMESTRVATANGARGQKLKLAKPTLGGVMITADLGRNFARAAGALQ